MQTNLSSTYIRILIMHNYKFLYTDNHDLAQISMLNIDKTPFQFTYLFLKKDIPN